jgi:hypothetical protein
MRNLRFLVAVCVLATVAGLPATALATESNNESATYEYLMEVPNVAMSADGDTVTVTGEGTFSVHPYTASGGGSFTLGDDGTTVSGTWTALDTIAFQPYGCGVVLGDPIRPDFCGGLLGLDVVLTPSSGPQMSGTLWVICIIGDIPGQAFTSRNATEGIVLNVPGVDNYNKQVSGMNVYILMDD